MAEILVKNRFEIGDRLEIIHPSGNQIIQLEQMQSLEGTTIQVAPGSGHRVRIPLTGNIEKAFVASSCLNRPIHHPAVTTYFTLTEKIG